MLYNIKKVKLLISTAYLIANLAPVSKKLLSKFDHDLPISELIKLFLKDDYWQRGVLLFNEKCRYFSKEAQQRTKQSFDGAVELLDRC